MSGDCSNKYDEDPYMQYIACNSQNSNCSSQEQINQAVFERNYKQIIPPEKQSKTNQSLKQAASFAEKRKPGENSNCAGNGTFRAALSASERPQLKLRRK